MSQVLNFLQIRRRDLLLVFFTGTGLLALIPIVTYIYFASDLVSQDKIMNRNNTGILLLDRTGTPFYNFYQAKSRKLIPLDDIPKSVQNAVIASEDHEFYQHPGFSIRGILRSLYINLTHENTLYGGSTITQQLVKNSLLKPEKSFLRKYQEIVLAQEIERRYTKNQILEMYLNSVYFGEGSFGIEQASETYFNKPASDLNLAEASLLVGLLPSPSQFDPFAGHIEQAQKHQQITLDKMVKQGYLQPNERDQALDTELDFKKDESELNNHAIHFALMVKDLLIKEYGEENIIRSGFTIKTSLDLKKQEFAEQVVKDQVKKLAPNLVSNGAAVVIDPKTGEVLSLVGSQDWFDEKDGKVNITLSPRQPGSSFKPIVYIAGFEKHLITPATVLHDQPTTYKIYDQTYSPKNYDGRFRGNVLVRRSLANSLNVPSVEIMSKVGVPSAIEMAHRLGIATTLDNPDNYGISLVLGAGEVKLLEMTTVYATLANQGLRNDPQLILEVSDKHGNNLYHYQPNPKRAIDPQDTFLISSILSDNNARSEVFGNALTISRPAAVKTGTTENYKDAWTLGYTPSLTVGVWVGNNDGHPMDQIAGSLGAAPIWRSLMEEFLKDTPIEKFEIPSGIVSKSVCQGNGLLTKEATSSGYLEYFLPGTEPHQFCSLASIPPSITPADKITPSSTQNPPQNDKIPPGQKKKQEGEVNNNVQVNDANINLSF